MLLLQFRQLKNSIDNERLAGWPLDLPSQSVDLGLAADALITDAISLINFLRAIDVASRRHCCLYTGPALRRACYRYKYYWLPLQLEHEEFVTPPLDVHWVIYCRLLASTSNSKETLHQAKFLPRSCNKRNRIAYWDKNGAKLWTTNYPNEPFDSAMAVSSSHDLDSVDEELFAEVESVARCQQVFYQHVCLSHFKSARYLYCAYIRLIQYRSLRKKATSGLPSDLQLLETVLTINGVLNKSPQEPADDKTLERAWRRKFSGTNSPFLNLNEQFWREYKPRNFGYFDILTQPRPTVTTVQTTQPPIWINFSTTTSGSKTIYHFYHVHDQFSFQANCSKGEIELYDANKKLVSYAKVVPGDQPLSQYQCSISRRREMEHDPFDGESIVQTDSEAVTMAVWNSAGLSLIVQLRDIVVATFERSLTSNEWIRRTKQIRLTPTCRRQPDQYHLGNNGTMKCNWASLGIVFFVTLNIFYATDIVRYQQTQPIMRI